MLWMLETAPNSGVSMHRLLSLVKRDENNNIRMRIRASYLDLNVIT